MSLFETAAPLGNAEVILAAVHTWVGDGVRYTKRAKQACQLPAGVPPVFERARHRAFPGSHRREFKLQRECALLLHFTTRLSSRD